MVRSGCVLEISPTCSADGLGMRCKRLRGDQEGSEGLDLDDWEGTLPLTKMKKAARGAIGSSVVHLLFGDVSEASEWRGPGGRWHVGLQVRVETWLLGCRPALLANGWHV